jgi:hypothetical protein
MLNKLQKIANAIHYLRLPSIAVGLFALISTVSIIFNSKSHADDFFLIPSLIALLWAMSSYFFIVTFRSVPDKPDMSLKFVARIKQNVSRAWYWLIGTVFLVTTLAAVAISSRMIYIWMKDYGG